MTLNALFSSISSSLWNTNPSIHWLQALEVKYNNFSKGEICHPKMKHRKLYIHEHCRYANTRMGHSISLTLLFIAKINAQTMLPSRVAERGAKSNKQTNKKGSSHRFQCHTCEVNNKPAITIPSALIRAVREAIRFAIWVVEGEESREFRLCIPSVRIRVPERVDVFRALNLSPSSRTRHGRKHEEH